MRQIPLSYRSHITGVIPTRRGVIRHESALERDFVMLTMFLDRHAHIVSQPMTFDFDEGGKRRRYTPDFEVMYADGSIEIVEVKYRADLRYKWTSLRPGFAVARDYAKRRGCSFRIATDRSIRGVLLDNAKRLLPLRDTPIDAAMAERVLGAVRENMPGTIEQALTSVGDDRALSLSTLWRLIAAKRLWVDLTRPIDGLTPVLAP